LRVLAAMMCMMEDGTFMMEDGAFSGMTDDGAFVGSSAGMMEGDEMCRWLCTDASVASAPFLCPPFLELPSVLPSVEKSQVPSEPSYVEASMEWAKGAFRSLPTAKVADEPTYVVSSLGGVTPPPGLEKCSWHCGTPARAHMKKGPGASRAPAQRQPVRKRHIPLRLASRLQELEDEDAACVFMVRRINKLGFGSAALLSEHYARFGDVANVLMSNSHEKSEDTSSLRVRLRPSGLGFVIMRRPEDVAAVLAEGEIQLVNGVEIQVRKFVPQEEAAVCGQASEAADDVCSSGPSTRCPSMGSIDAASSAAGDEGDGEVA